MVGAMVERERGEVYGEVADGYDEVRPGYPDALGAAVLGYPGALPRRAVEVGAGTGKATALFARHGVPVHCLEPDPRMASVLRERMAAYPGVGVEVRRFEDWQPPGGGVDLLYSAQAWHWVDPETRWPRAHAALAPGGAVAIFGHSYDLVDPAIEAALWELQRQLQTETSTMAPPGPVDPDSTWFSVELARSGLFTDLRTHVFHTIVAYPTATYLALVRTFSAYRMLPPAGRSQMRDALIRIVDEHGGTVEIDLTTILALGLRSDDRPTTRQPSR